MYSAQYFSIFTTEKNRYHYRTQEVGANCLVSRLLLVLPVYIRPESQSYYYAPLFRLCHHRRVKAP
jgi:hypothetical protein